MDRLVLRVSIITSFRYESMQNLIFAPLSSIWLDTESVWLDKTRNEGKTITGVEMTITRENLRPGCLCRRSIVQ